ncbi:isocitrate lyase/phosphoenolpyruvate mutase family protein [Streptomyces sp. H10-C2]|uniref:isocitrate lyase/PEP mutase family protein n=1 Tax=unclassified Streptomyces TaxID=2593676 RepID=UPI0024BA4CBC|nr:MULTISPECIES: isocitrate lyase/phosphoenolpyruvate mutase family protein [unclassified Streptomyces]MDJ0342380.1 isocitrate lyase/phosphoenolpyruvate mutase family protein [Streptomyces sp. PH10-H1]MDJ0372235.1 isocitrate lyase/phosphoenolpyruvate mutase family protein [Streptomyces sp. H10-C2]
MPNLRDKALLLHSLHTADRPLALANAWDVASARIIEEAGAAAVATTSCGVAWSLGYADGDRLPRELALALIGRVAAAVGVPVSADIESGFADDADGVAETVRGVLAAGAVGINIEDALANGPTQLRAVDEQAERIAAARKAADAADVPLFINARTDVYLSAVGEPGTRLDATLERAAAYLAAGASGIFVPGVTDLALIADLAKRIDAPLNVLTGPGAPSVAELAGAGAARVSIGGRVAESAYGLVRRAAREFLDAGTCTSVEDGLGYGDLQALFTA